MSMSAINIARGARALGVAYNESGGRVRACASNSLHPSLRDEKTERGKRNERVNG